MAFYQGLWNPAPEGINCVLWTVMESLHIIYTVVSSFEGKCQMVTKNMSTELKKMQFYSYLYSQKSPFSSIL